MKSFKLLAAASLAAGFASAAFAAPLVVNITGSTAFRSATTLGEITLLSHASGGGAASPTGAFVGAGPFTKATYSIVHGFLADGVTEVYIRNDWTGATAGVTDLANGNTALTWVPTGSIGSVALASDGTGGTSLATGANTDTGAPMVSMDDEQANDSAASIVGGPNPGPTYAANILNAALQAGGTSTGANAGPVAAVTFAWAAGVQSTGTGACPISNITQEQAAALLVNGYLPLSVFTGNSADASNFVFMIGRNEDSGSRCAYEAESLGGGIGGAGAFGAPIQQFMLKQSGVPYPANNAYASLSVGSNTIAGFKLWPASWAVNTIPTLNWRTIGHSGYNTGGDVATILETPNPVVTTGWTVANAPAGFTVGTSKAYFVSCLGTSDALAVAKLGGTILSYNGNLPATMPAVSGSATAYSDFVPVVQGQYSIWTTEFLYYLNSATGTQVAVGAAKPVADGLADLIWSTTTSGLGNAGVEYNSIVAKKSGVPAGSFPQ
jgi:hypothetical protein